MAYTFNTELKSIAATYLELIAVKVTKTSIKTALEESPHYPSLLALSDVFLIVFSFDNSSRVVKASVPIVLVLFVGFLFGFFVWQWWPIGQLWLFLRQL